MIKRVGIVGSGIMGSGIAEVAAKAGFFKALLVALVALKKVIIVGLVALIAFLKRFFGRKNAKVSGRTA